MHTHPGGTAGRRLISTQLCPHLSCHSTCVRLMNTHLHTHTRVHYTMWNRYMCVCRRHTSLSRMHTEKGGHSPMMLQHRPIFSGVTCMHLQLHTTGSKMPRESSRPHPHQLHLARGDLGLPSLGQALGGGASPTPSRPGAGGGWGQGGSGKQKGPPGHCHRRGQSCPGQSGNTEVEGDGGDEAPRCCLEAVAPSRLSQDPVARTPPPAPTRVPASMYLHARLHAPKCRLTHVHTHCDNSFLRAETPPVPTPTLGSRSWSP